MNFWFLQLRFSTWEAKSLLHFVRTHCFLLTREGHPSRFSRSDRKFWASKFFNIGSDPSLKKCDRIGSPIWKKRDRIGKNPIWSVCLDLLCIFRADILARSPNGSPNGVAHPWCEDISFNNCHNKIHVNTVRSLNFWS